MTEETTPKADAQQPDESKPAKPKAAEDADETPAEKAKPAKAKPAAAKKPKEPALEDKPFTEFMEQHFTPALKKALEGQGLKDLQLTFSKEQSAIAGAINEQYWQVIGRWQNGQRQFNLYFPDEDINGRKGFSWATNGIKPSDLESFMIDERKVTLDLMVSYTLQRLNGQKWLTRN